mmetsp:Transcript_20608/g.45136  ORF Transcript_20608/g.45136 Transcript_20608/m.45136 type:complete len:310 (-) Transcript_20608:349-1278(-)
MTRRTSLGVVVVVVILLASLVYAEEDEYDYSDISEELPPPSYPRDLMKFPNWLPFHKLLSDEAEQWKQSGDLDLLFLGDSLTETWRGTDGGKSCLRCKAVPEVFAAEFGHLKAAAFGIAADRTPHLLWRLQNGELPEGLKARVVVILIGTNDLGQKEPATAQETIKGIKGIVDYVHTIMPDAHVVSMAILPRGRISHHQQVTISRIRTNITFVNEQLQAHWHKQGNPQIKFLDCSEFFVDEAYKAFVKRDLLPDFLHLNEQGHQKWAQCLHPVLAEQIPSKHPASAKISQPEENEGPDSLPSDSGRDEL